MAQPRNPREGTHIYDKPRDYDHQYDHLPLFSSAAYPSRHPPSQPSPNQSDHLIDRVTNKWKESSSLHDDSSSSYDDDYPDYYREKDSLSWEDTKDLIWPLSMLRYRRARRIMLIYILLLVSVYIWWKWYLRPDWAETKVLEQSFRNRTDDWGRNARPDFADMVQVKTLDERFLPRPTDPKGGPKDKQQNRLVIVGDVHGCRDELLALLDKVKFRAGNDHLILTGDMIAKGPDSPGTVDVARKLGASCVRGNHEDRMLLAYNAMHSHHLPLPLHEELESPDHSDDHDDDDDSAAAADTLARDRNAIDEESMTHADFRARRLARSFTRPQIAYLQSCPVILRVGLVPTMGSVTVVHAGLVPGVPLERMDPFQAMNMRTVDLGTHVPSEDRRGYPWERWWNFYQKKVAADKRSTVVYGHDSKRGLNIKRWSKGLDSGCVNGGRLTALVIRGDGRQEVVSVKCKKQGGYKRKA